MVSGTILHSRRYTVHMFDNPEIKRLRQDIDALSEQIENLIEKVEVQHTDVMNKLDLMEQKVEQETEELSEKIEETKSDIESGLEDVVVKSFEES